MRHLTLTAAALLAFPLAASAAGEGGGSPFSGDIGNALWTLVIFVALLFVLGKFAWGPILERLQAREDFIHDALAQAKQQRDEAAAELAKYQEQLASARGEATAIVEEGRRDAVVVKQRIEDEAREEAERIVARARREIEVAKDTAVKELYEQATALATEAASRIIGKELDPQDHERLIAESIEALDGLRTN